MVWRGQRQHRRRRQVEGGLNAREEEEEDGGLGEFREEDHENQVKGEGGDEKITRVR